jgi:hypothetical protein
MASLLYKGNRGIRMIWNKHVGATLSRRYLVNAEQREVQKAADFEQKRATTADHAPPGPAVLLLIRRALVLVSVVRRGNAPVNAEQGSGSAGFSKSAAQRP